MNAAPQLSDLETARAAIDTSLDAVAALIKDCGARQPAEESIREMQAEACAIIRAAVAGRREAVGVAAHMFCNYIDGLQGRGAWSPRGVSLHYDAMRRLEADLDRSVADCILQDVLKLSSPAPAPA